MESESESALRCTATSAENREESDERTTDDLVRELPKLDGDADIVMRVALHLQGEEGFDQEELECGEEEEEEYEDLEEVSEGEEDSEEDFAKPVRNRRSADKKENEMQVRESPKKRKAVEVVEAESPELKRRSPRRENKGKVQAEECEEDEEMQEEPPGKISPRKGKEEANPAEVRSPVKVSKEKKARVNVSKVAKENVCEEDEVLEEECLSATQIVPVSQSSEETGAPDSENHHGQMGQNSLVSKVELPSGFPPAVDSLDGSSKTLYKYMRKTNRPFGIPDLSRAFNSLTKLQITKALQVLNDKGLVTKNDKKVYWIDQSDAGSDAGELKEKMKSAIQQLEGHCAGPREELKSLQRIIARLENEPGDKVLEDDVRQLREELETSQAVLDEAKASEKENEQSMMSFKGAASKSPEDLLPELKFYRSAWKERKAKVEDLVKDIQDGMSAKTKFNKLVEDIGIETDETARVSLKDIILN